MPDASAPVAPTPAPIDKAKAAGAGVLGLAAISALAMTIAGLKPDEGKANVDYLDIARIPTACFGHTGADVHVGRRRTDAECDAMLSADARIRLSAVARCVPGLHSRPAIWAASTRMAFNTGAAAFCGSSTARAFNAGQWRAGCDTMLRWDKARIGGRLVVVPGLAARRQRERAQCLSGVAA